MRNRIIPSLFFVIGMVTPSLSQITPPSGAPKLENFKLDPNSIGSASNSVNLFTGDLNLPFNLVSLTGREGLDVNVSISYNSNVQNQVDTWNLEAPSGILGLGWNMDMPKIVCDHKGTGTREDDTYYLIEGGTSNKLIRAGSGSDSEGSYNVYQTKSYQFWQIRFYYDPYDYAQFSIGSNKWVVIKENGIKYVYGDKNSGRSTIQYIVRWNNWIGSSSNVSGQTQMASAWNLSEINNLHGEKITFEYVNEEQFVGSAFGQKHTEASYLKQIVDPMGRMVKFFYKSKDSQFYMEPHTEQAEPDAYQEIYEKQYLDHIDVFDETGAKNLSVNFRYSTINDGTNTAKMLLSYFEKRNAAGQALPGVQFDYCTTTGPTGYKGFLQKITYPMGGTVSYAYSMTGNSIGHSKRDLDVSAHPIDGDGPYGYSEPNIWFGSDYVVVAWRALGPGGTHITGPSAVKLYVYQWVGEWKGQFLQSIYNVSASFNSATKSQYTDFQVVLEDNFFGVLTHPTGTTYHTYIRYKNASIRGHWLDYDASNLDLGTGTPSFISGKDFIAVQSASNSGVTVGQLYTFLGSTFSNSPITGVSGVISGFTYLGAGHNYFLKHFQDISFLHWIPPQMTFSYLNEEKKWQSSNLSSSIVFSGLSNDGFHSPTRFHGSNSYLMAMAGQNPEFIYRWDLNYTNFVRDNGAGSLFGFWDDNSYVFNMDNSMIGLVDYHVNARSARFDGNSWLLSSPHNTRSTDFVGVSPDLMASTSSNNLSKVLSIYNPNLLSWSQTTSNEKSYGMQMGYNFYNNGVTDFYRIPNGTWNPIGSNQYGFIGGNFFITYFRAFFFKNGAFSSNVVNLTEANFGYREYDQFGKLVSRNLLGSNTVVFIFGRQRIPQLKDATALQICRSVNENLIGSQVDYPVSLITINNGLQNNFTSIDYNFSTAAIDPSGAIAQYNEVSVIPGTNTPSVNKPFGYTTTYFNNGLTSLDDPSIPSNPKIEGVYHAIDMHWLGLPYQTKAFDQGNSVVSTTNTYYSINSKIVTNSFSAQVDVGYYVRPSLTRSLVDGIESTNSYAYSTASGQLITGINKVAGTVISQNELVYWWEKYDPTNTRNLLTPVIQTTRFKNDVYLESQVNRYKNWNANLIVSTFPGIADSYTWKRTGMPPNLFSTWDTSIQPSSDWQFVNKISKRDDDTGIVLENTSTGNFKSATIMNATKTKVLAQATNAGFDEIAYTGFEDASKGNWAWSDGTITLGISKTGDKSINIGTIGITKTGLVADETYIISFWMKKALANSGSVLIDGVGDIGWDNVSSNCTYFEYKVKNLTSLTIKNSGSATVYIDDLRFHPSRSRMTTQTYHPLFGVSSQTDANDQTMYTDFDEFGRTKGIMDNEKNIISNTIYNYKKQ